MHFVIVCFTPLVRFSCEYPVNQAARKKNMQGDATNFNACFQVVLRARLQREGVLHMPVGESGVETVTDLKRALELAQLYLSK